MLMVKQETSAYSPKHTSDLYTFYILVQYLRVYIYTYLSIRSIFIVCVFDLNYCYLSTPDIVRNRKIVVIELESIMILILYITSVENKITLPAHDIKIIRRGGLRGNRGAEGSNPES